MLAGQANSDFSISFFNNALSTIELYEQFRIRNLYRNTLKAKVQIGNEKGATHKQSPNYVKAKNGKGL